jgi:hypothetical protein
MRIPAEHQVAVACADATIGVAFYRFTKGTDAIGASPLVIDTVTGPCARCRKPHFRYGPSATSSLCADCQAPNSRTASQSYGENDCANDPN